ncbi:MAG: hypothetical protein Q4D54_00995 [Eubacteriales bacterium]|nr:hypothetical protein [Lachnospiraceae bacterium]MDO5126307.1 hypothetical protein [Eubacteriales bacterium]
MGMIKKKPYYFSDSSVASDTIIAFVMGGISLAIELASVVISFATLGHVPDIFGTLYLCAFILSVVGEIFAWLGNKAQEGGVKGKRVSIALNILTMLVPIWILLRGL